MRNYREAIDIIRGSNDNTIEGRGRTLRRNHFFDGVVRERDGGRERGLLLGKEHETPLPRRSRRPTAKDVTMQANAYRASFRNMKKMCYLTHGLEGSDVDFFLHKNKVCSIVMSLASWCTVWGKRAPWNSVLLQCFLLLYPTIMCFTA